MEEYIDLLTEVATDMMDWNDWYDCIINKTHTLSDIPSKYRDFEMCKLAIENDCAKIEDIPANIIDIRLYESILKKDGLQLGYVDIDKRSYELCLMAAKNDGASVQWIPEDFLDSNMCLALIQCRKHSSNIFSFIKNKLNNFLINELIKYHPEYFPLIPYRLATVDISYKAVCYDGMFLGSVYNRYKTYDVCKKAVCMNGMALQFVPEKNMKTELIMLALHSDGMALQFVPYKMKTPGMCQLAMKKNKNASMFVPQNIKRPF